jgi:membrane protein implicated in regulation of membrane protease activity
MMTMDPKKKILPFLAFFIVANPATFKLVRSVAGSWVASAEGLPTTLGLLLHALVYVLLVTFLWRLVYGKKSKYGMEGLDLYEEETYEGEEKSE